MKLFRRANLLYGLLYQLERRIDDAKKNLKPIIKKTSKHKTPRVFIGSTLPVTDLDGSTDDGWLKWYPSGGFQVRDRRYLSSLDAIVSRNAAWAVSQGYEGFETFLKDISASYLYRNKSKANSTKLTKFNDAPASSGLLLSKLEYWRAFVTYSCRGGRNNKKYFALLRNLAPGLSQGEVTNNRNLDLPKWYGAASEVRHAVTHADFELKPERWDGLTDDLKILSQLWFPCKMKSGRRLLNLSIKHAERDLRTFCEYGFMIFKHLSKTRDYDWDIFEKGFKVGKSEP